MFIEADDAEKGGVWRCARVGVAQPWFTYFVSAGPMPLPRAQRTSLMAATTELLKQVQRTTRFELSIWLLLDELHKENAVTEISRNAAIWRPELGMGLRLDEPSPRYWTSDDLLERDYSTEMPTLKHTVVGLDTDEAGAELACALMTGRGALIQVLHSEPISQVVTRWYDVLQPTIVEEGLAAYPLYVPLLNLASIHAQTADNLDRLMGRAVVYVRESAEDRGMLILSRTSLDESLRKLERMVFESGAAPGLLPGSGQA